ncbi:hematopoietic prostaglandin D synthase-like [Daphnia pulicaria]|uniref:hematopoietic prostaglandin D synthase-like n=1 Tax=Daphnia pulicaria TaxID=35523 RepID=UPI001EEB39DE|nr:hematopoietic prostaglandin D synthase-like [Daphnia pulicaria]
MSTRRRNEYKLHYFNMKGRAELARLIMAYAKVPYEDIRYEMTEWPQHKAKMPNGQVPVLEWKGQFLTESLAIVRFLARRHNLAGTDDWQWAKIDAVNDHIGNTFNDVRPVFYAGDDQEKKKEAIDNFFKNSVEPLLKSLDKHLEDNGADYIIGNQCTLADLALFNFYDFITGAFGADRVPKCQHVAALHARIGQVPAIAAWMEKRPVTPM